MVKSRVVMFAVLAVAAAAFAGLFISSIGEQAAAQTTNNNQTTSSPTTNQANTIPQLNGSVSIRNATNDFVKNNVKVAFNDAANTAKAQVPNGVVIGGGLSEVQGYLTYVFKVANYNAGTMKAIIVDAGNGKVLYTSNDMPLYNGGLGGGFGCGGHGGHHFRHFGGFGYGYNEGHGMSGSTTPNNNNNSGQSTGGRLVMPTSFV
jgi:uncharacterized membrane protein YkoI